MATKTISIKEEAYKQLKALKTDGQSFSDVILKLTEESRGNFANIIGEGANAETSDIREARERADDERRNVLR
jgi:predicted CopG family antitoxin